MDCLIPSHMSYRELILFSSLNTSVKQNNKQNNDQPDLLEDFGYYLFNDDITVESVSKCMRFIIEKNLQYKNLGNLHPEMLHLFINSEGGDLSAALALTDIMKSSSIPVRTYGLGIVASAGLMIFMAGEKGARSITPNTAVLSHQYSASIAGKEHELYATVKEFKLTTQKVLDHYLQHTSLSKRMIKKYLLPQTDVWLSVEEAVKYGIADLIVDKLI